jgi:dienelactone hydrolase
MRVVLLLLLACASPPPVPPADRGRLLRLLDAPFAEGPLEPLFGEDLPQPGYRVRPVSLSLRPGFRIAGALFVPEDPTPAGVIVPHGHFDQGKSAPESQEIAHRLARRGARVLLIDSPGVEEWTVPGRLLHFAEGLHHRAFLAAGGSSALALQVALLRRGLDFLQGEGAERIGATGASGGAVLSFYLLAAEPRVEVAALASFVPIPREARPSGCACDQLPGWPGPDPGLLALADRPSLWLSEVPQPRPAGLGEAAEFKVLEGPHGYPAPMQEAALDFLADHLPLRDPVDEGPLPLLDLRTEGPTPDALGILDLPLRPEARWSPQPLPAVPWLGACEGSGPRVLVAGGGPEDLAALRGAGLAPCPVDLPEDEIGVEEAIGRGGAYADRQAGGLQAAAKKLGVTSVYAVRAWGLPASALGLPFVVREPLRSAAAVDPARDPAWVHVPGAWWGAMDAALAPALATGDDPLSLAAALGAARR